VLGRLTKANRFDTAVLVLSNGMIRILFAEQGRLSVI